MMKICQVCAVDFTVEKFLTPLIDRMTCEGWSVVTVCSKGDLVNDLRKRGYIINTLPISRSINPILAIRTIILLFTYFRKNKFDVIHVHTPVAALLARIAAKYSCKSFVVYTAHGFYFHEHMNVIKKIFFIWLEKIAGRCTDLLFCQSQEDSMDAINYSIVDKSNVVTIGNGVDVSKFDMTKYAPHSLSIKQELNIPENAKVVGIVARMVKEKGYYEFLNAAIELSRKHSDLYFLLIGGKLESDHDSNVNDVLIKAKKILGKNLLILGLRKDVPQLISIMDIFCLPSYREGLPRTIIEAMFLKKPVVATNIRGSREEVLNNETGLLVPPRNHVELTLALDFLLCNLNVAKQMGENGFIRAQKLYDEKKIVEHQISIIKQKCFTNI